MSSNKDNIESNASSKKKKSAKKAKFIIKDDDYIQNALEKALTDIQYWENWKEIIQRLGYALNKSYRHEDVSKAIDVLFAQISLLENKAWKDTFMWALGQSGPTRRKILHKAKEKFLISDREGWSYEIMSHLDPRFFLDAEKANEEDFKKAIRNYFELKEPNFEEEKEDENIPG